MTHMYVSYNSKHATQPGTYDETYNSKHATQPGTLMKHTIVSMQPSQAHMG